MLGSSRVMGFFAIFHGMPTDSHRKTLRGGNVVCIYVLGHHDPLVNRAADLDLAERRKRHYAKD